MCVRVCGADCTESCAQWLLDRQSGQNAIELSSLPARALGAPLLVMGCHALNLEQCDGVH